jgi:hypothetical protein
MAMNLFGAKAGHLLKDWAGLQEKATIMKVALRDSNLWL